jgi:hypothetical protein
LESTKIYIKIHNKMLLHVSVCDHHQGARTWAWQKLQLLKMFGKIRRYEHEVMWQHAATPLHNQPLNSADNWYIEDLIIK